MTEQQEIIDCFHLKEGEEQILYHEFIATDTSLSNARDVNPAQHLEKITNTINLLDSQEGGYSESSREYFICKMIPQFTYSLLHRGNPPDQISKFLFQVISLIVKYLDTKYFQPLAELLQQIFNSKYKFYDQSYFRDNSEKHEFAEARDHFVCVSKYLLYSINYFGKVGGFAKILEILSGPNGTIPFTRVIIRAILEASTYFTFTFANEFLPKIKDILFTTISSLNDEQLKNEDVSVLQEICNTLERSYRHFDISSKSREEFERFNLQMTLKYFKSPYLTVRLAGLNDIKGVISKCDVKGPMRDEVIWITSRFLVNWIRENQILELLYRDNVHSEIVRRCAEIPIFLANENEITLKDIDLIWEAGVDKHEAITHSIYALLCSLSQHLSREHLNYLFSHVKKIPVPAYDTNIVSLVRAITFYGLNGVDSDNTEFYGLGIMWEVIQDEVNLSAEIKSQATTLLRDFIPWKYSFNFRLPILKLAIENLKIHKSSCAAMRVIQITLNSFLQDQPSIQNLSELIQQLNEEYGIISLFFNDLVYYKSFVKDQISQSENLKAHPDLWNNHCFTKQSHLTEIQERLDFLQFILQKSNITLSQADIDNFWSSSITGSLTNEEREIGLRWLEFRENDHGQSIFTDESLLYIFEKKLGSLDIENLSLDGLNLIFSFFKTINFKTGKLQRHPKQDVEFLVASFDLIGMLFLWEICFSVKRVDVSKRAISILFSLQKSVAPELLPQVGSQRIEFVKFCMAQLTEAANTDSIDERVEHRVLRCLAIINSYIEEFDPKELSIKRHGSIGKGKLITIKVEVPNKQNSSFTLEIFQNETVKILKEKVATQLNMNPKIVRILTAGKDLNVDTRTLDSYGVVNGQTIKAIPVPRRAKESMRDAALEYAPSCILSKPNYFDQIFNLLSLPDIISKKAWELLMLLPTNEAIMKDLNLLETDAPNWNEILNINSLYKLLYSLQIIESIVDTQGATAQEIEKKLAWGSKFYDLGGLRYLLTIVTASDLPKFTQPKSKTCIAFIFQIIVHFIHRLGNDASGSDPSMIVQKLLEIIYTSSTFEFPGVEDATIVEGSLGLFTFYCNDPVILKQFLELPKLSEFLAKTLILCRNSKIRTHMKNTIEQLTKNTAVVDNKSTLCIFFNIVLSFLPSIDLKLNTYSQYFELFNYCIRAINDDPKLKEAYAEKFDVLAATLVESFINHPVVEADSRTLEDSILIGYLKLLRALLSFNDSYKEKYGMTLVTNLYSFCLFQFPTLENRTQSQLKCKTKRSRLAAFRLLHEVCKNNKINFMSATQQLIPHHSHFGPNVWNYSPTQLEKSPAGYVGLVNQGATCYMNSLMQQFFMNNKFRSGFLTLPLPEEELHENVVYQMQKIFANLQESQKKFFNTIGFCKSYKDYSGEAINPGIQMDADEFFNMLFEKLENAMKGTKRESFFKDIYGGKVCNQVISKECDHVSENFEDYYTLSVAVKGKSTLEEAFDLFVEGDLLEGDNKYQCGQCNSKVDALRRCCIAELPNDLIVHMRRFEFDLEEMRKLKVNDHCQFPMILDLEPYTKEGLARKEAERAGKPVADPIRKPSYYQYELRGILVHTGTADSGHYYSFIKDCNSNHWYQFNDREVDLFDERDIANQCYGGLETVNNYDPVHQKYNQEVRQKINNAYMLFYHRIQPEATASDNISFDTAASNDLFNSIWKDNIQFCIDKYVFDKDYFTFLLNLLKVSKFGEDLSASAPLNPESPGFRAIELGTRFLVQTLLHSKVRDQVKSFVEVLIEKYSTNIPACKWFLSTAIQDGWTKTFLIACPANDAREAFAALVSHVLATLAPFERSIYLTEINEEERDLSYYIKQEERREIDETENFTLNASFEEDLFKNYTKDFSSQSHSIWFIESITKDLKYLRENWRNFEQYFNIFRDFAKLGDEEKAFLLSRNVIAKFIDFYLGDESPLVIGKNYPKRHRMGMKYKSPVFSPMVELISDLVCRTRISEDITPASLVEPILSISDIDRHFVTFETFLHRGLAENHNIEKLSAIICHISWGNEKSTTSMLNLISHGIYTDENSFHSYLIPLSNLLRLTDDLQSTRIQNTMESLLKVLDNCSAMIFFNIVRFLACEAAENVHINNWMFNIINSWIAKWLIVHNFDHVRGATEELIQALVYEDAKAQTFNEERKVFIFDLLLETMSVCSQHTAVSPFSFPIQDQSDSHYQCCAYKLVEYFRLFRWFLTSEEYVDKVMKQEKHLDRLLGIFDTVDLRHYETDENKRQIVTLLDHIVEMNIEYAGILLSRKTFIKRVLDYYISLGSDELNMQYNNTTLQVLYKLIKKFCLYDKKFLSEFILHKNFFWSFEFLCLADDFNLAGLELFEAAKHAFSDQRLRHKVISLIINSDKTRIRIYNYKGAVSYFDQLIQSFDDLVYFCQNCGLDFLSAIDAIKCDFEYDSHSLSIAEPTLNLIARTTEWMLSDFSENPKLLEISQNWESKTDLFLTLTNLLNTCTIDSILCPTYKILFNLSASDESLLEMLLDQLQLEHENYYNSIIYPHDFSYISGPKKPCIKAHLHQFSGKDKIHMHEEYYLFLRRLCEFAFSRFQNDGIRCQSTINLLFYAFVEILPSPGIHASFIELMDLPQVIQVIPESKVLEYYLYKVFTSESQVLENQECYVFIKELFTKKVDALSKEHKALIASSFQTLLEDRTKDLQSGNYDYPSFVSDMISFVKLSSLMLVDGFGVLVQSPQFNHFVNTLRAVIPADTTSFPLQELKTAIQELEAQFKAKV